MAKKKTVKKTAKKKQTENTCEKSDIGLLSDDISELNSRIDRIIDAHEKCKSLKGL